MKTLATAFAFLAVSNLSVNAQSYSWMHYDHDNSPLPSNTINATLSTEQGVWVGTDEGLAIYDGSDWVVYTSETSQLPDNNVRDIHQDNWGNTWIATDMGVLRIDDSGWYVFNEANSNIPSNTVRSVTTDSEGNLWIGTWGNGIARLNGSNWTVYNTSNSGLPSNGVFTVEVDDFGHVYVGTYNGGVSVLEGQNWTTFNTSNSELPHNHVRTIVFDDNQTLWFGTDDGLAKFSNGIWDVHTYQNIGFSVHTIYDGVKQSSGDVFFGTDGGIVHFTSSDFEVITAQNSNLISNNIRALTLDENGNVWLGTGNDGLSIYSPQGTLGIEARNDQQIDISVFPNPTTSQININIPNSINSPTSVQLYNAAGQLVVSEAISNMNQPYQLNIEHLPVGTYHILVKNDIKMGSKTIYKL